MAHKPQFNWGISIGNIIQIVLLMIGMVGLYYQIVQDVESNTADIALNKNEIRDLRADMRETRSEILDELKENLQPIREDVRWLVRREAEKSGD